MKKTGIFYGSTTGTTEEIAGQIAEALGINSDDVRSASELSEELIASYEALILGTATWGEGELQDDWYDAVEVLRDADLSGKTLAFFGCGDSSSYADTFCDAMGLLYEAAKGKCSVVGAVSASDYDFAASKAQEGDKLIGLAIDEVNESDKTADRVAAWTEALKAELA